MERQGDEGVVGPPDFRTYRAREAETRRAWARSCVVAAGGNISEAAKKAGLDRSNFKRILRRAGAR